MEEITTPLNERVCKRGHTGYYIIAKSGNAVCAECGRMGSRFYYHRNKKTTESRASTEGRASSYSLPLPIVALPVSPEELLKIAKRETWVDRKTWALEVLELVQSKPNEWLKLEGTHPAGRATKYLKPLGIKYTMDTTKHETLTQVVLYVKWETE